MLPTSVSTTGCITLVDKHPHRIPNHLAANMDRIMLAREPEVLAMLAMGETEVGWSRQIDILWFTLQTDPEIMEPEVWSGVIDHLVATWPQSLWQRLPWGSEPQFEHLGGISCWGFELALDRLDYLLAETVGMAHRTPWTDLAWRTMARLGTLHHRCPDCGHCGPQHQMELFGIIKVCNTSEGVDWGSGGALY